MLLIIIPMSFITSFLNKEAWDIDTHTEQYIPNKRKYDTKFAMKT